MSSQRKRKSGNRSKPVAHNVHAILVKAAAEKDPRIAARLVELFGGKLDQKTLLQILEMHTYVLSVSLQMHRLAAGDKPVDDLVASVEHPAEVAEDLVRREFERFKEN